MPGAPFSGQTEPLPSPGFGLRRAQSVAERRRLARGGNPTARRLHPALAHARRDAFTRLGSPRGLASRAVALTVIEAMARESNPFEPGIGQRNRGSWTP